MEERPATRERSRGADGRRGAGSAAGVVAAPAEQEERRSGPGLAAVDYARRGWRVFPCHAPAKGACSCGAGEACPSPAKHPRTRHGLHDASAAEEVVARWWRRWPGANVGVRTGDGLVVLDVDPAHGGAESLAALEADHGVLPATAAVGTGSGGLHLYFRHDGPLRNSAGALGPGLDVRADGGYVIAPPSWHMAGARYRWETTVLPAPLPGWVLGRLARPAPPSRAVVAVAAGTNASAWAAAALAGEVDRVVHAVEGQRNHTLNRSAFVLGQIVGGGHLDAAEVADLLARAGEAAGLGAREAAATVASGLAAGTRWPRHPRLRPAPGAPVEGTGRRAAAEAPATPPPSPVGDVVSLEEYVRRCAARLWRPQGGDARRWLGVERGLPDDVLALNRVGADPGGAGRARPPGVATGGPAVVVPVIEDGRVVGVHLRPLGPAGRPAGAVGSVAVLRPVTVRGSCVVVTGDVVDALSACAGGYRAAVVGPAAGDGWAAASTAQLVRLGAPLALAAGDEAAEHLRAGLASAGARVARLHLPGSGGLNERMLRSSDWPRDLDAALRWAWSCEHRPRRLVR